MTLKLYNTLTRSKGDFEPQDPANIGMYVCGPTVYDYAHIGNARPIIVFDVLFRLLRHVYGPEHVTYVRNITDVEDKINARAAEEGISIGELTERTTAQFHRDIAQLGVLEPTFEPRATDFVARADGRIDMISMITTLIDKGHAYAADGHVLFDVTSMADYGRLAGRSTDDMVAGARVEVAPYKKGPMDFVLWKPSSQDEPGWDSPWGRGRPGWHIECSAMSAAYLGQTFDIHGGGIDLTFPHHENEVAQSRCCFGTPVMANVWMHNGFLQVEGDKMSKSLGNFITIHDLLEEGWPGEVLRLNMLRTQYRQPIDWTRRGLEESTKILDNWYAAIGEAVAGEPDQAVIDALLDDMNTPKAIAELHELRNRAAHGDETAAARLKASAALLGLLPQTQAEWLAVSRDASDIDAAQVEDMIAARNAARGARDFTEADRLRDELEGLGVALKDGPDGTTWEVKR